MPTYNPNPFAAATPAQRAQVRAANRVIAQRFGFPSRTVWHLVDAGGRSVKSAADFEVEEAVLQQGFLREWLARKQMECPGDPAWIGLAFAPVRTYPAFHTDWNLMMEAWSRMAAWRGRPDLKVVCSEMRAVWVHVAEYCKADVGLLKEVVVVRQRDRPVAAGGCG